MNLDEVLIAVQRVRDLHSPVADSYSITGSFCKQCGSTYPCKTMLALVKDGAMDYNNLKFIGD